MHSKVWAKLFWSKPRHAAMLICHCSQKLSKDTQSFGILKKWPSCSPLKYCLNLFGNSEWATRVSSQTSTDNCSFNCQLDPPHTLTATPCNHFWKRGNYFPPVIHLSTCSVKSSGGNRCVKIIWTVSWKIETYQYSLVTEWNLMQQLKFRFSSAIITP